MIDLHTHTLFSDGTLRPTELVAEAAAEGLTAIAITDHDTTEGVAEGLAAGRALGVRVLPGVEMSTEHEGTSLHLLGYFFHGGPSLELQEVLGNLRRARGERNERILARLRELGAPIDEAALATVPHASAIGRPHIAEALRRAGYATSLDDAFQRFLQRGAPAWVERRRPGLLEAIRLLVDSGAAPVLAHPGIIPASANELDRIVHEATEAGLAGIECFYPLHNAATERRFLQLCAHHNLAATGGSDYHGTIKPKLKLGVGANGARFPSSVLADLERHAPPSRRVPPAHPSPPVRREDTRCTIDAVTTHLDTANTDPASTTDLLNRLRRIEGQTRGCSA